MLVNQRTSITGVILLLTSLLSACGGGGGGNVSGSVVGGDSDAALDQQLTAIITDQGLTGKPAEGHAVVTPQDSPEVKLGEMLFFSKALSLDYQTACASCHHPKLGSGDDLSLPIGVAAVDQAVLGPARKVGIDPGPLADGGPDVPRNSQPIFNAALYQTAMFWDGRVFSIGTDEQGVLQIVTPESGKHADAEAGNSLLQAQARFPIVSPDEMRGYHHPELETGPDVRNFLLARLRGEVDTTLNYDPANDSNMTAADRQNWLNLFSAAYGAGDATSLITFAHIQAAIAAYEGGQIFVRSPWNAYVQGNKTAISDTAKQGAELFFLPLTQGGLGCAACHAGDRFTDEGFHNVGFPQFGHGKRPDRNDFGRFDVVQSPENMYAFRTPSLLNVMDTGPWGHDGEFGDMTTLLQYHANPGFYVTTYDIHNLAQFPDAFVGAMLSNYQMSLTNYTDAALAASSFAQDKLPLTQLSNSQVAALEAFLSTLSDPVLAAYRLDDGCQGKTPCPGEWVPRSGDAGTDNNTLFAVFQDAGGNSGSSGDNGDTTGSSGVSYPTSVAMSYPSNTASLTNFADASGCVMASSASNTGSLSFVESAQTLGLGSAVNGYSESSWLADNSIWVETLMESGSLSAAYLNGDCWPDLVFGGGDSTGLLTFINKGDGTGFNEQPLIDASVFNSTGISAERVSDILPVDLNGDYRRELVLGNTQPGKTAVLAWSDSAGKYVLAGSLPMGRNTFSISAGDINNDGYPDLYLAHWGGGGLPGSAPALFVNDGGGSLSPQDGAWKVGTANGMTQTFNFTPAFADINGDGKQDLLVASDFLTSWMSHNTGNSFVNDDPSHQTLIDANGMGQTLGDFDNDGLLDWFVTAIFDPDKAQRPANSNWGVIGNQLYRNTTQQTANAPLTFQNVTSQAGVANAGWGWGTCAADFNNDGWLDLFVENGFGFIPNTLVTDQGEALREMYAGLAAGLFNTQPKLFINNGDGTFTDVSAQMNFKPSNGRGVVCFDFDHDGDVDIGVNNNSGALLFYVNQLGSGAGHHFINIRLVGKSPNTDALGAWVSVSADLKGDGKVVRQVREVNANSHFVSHDLTNLHFGLGSATTANVGITWPDGSTETFSNVGAQQFVVYKQSGS